MNKYKKEVAALLAAIFVCSGAYVMARQGAGNDASKPDAWCVFGQGATRDSNSLITNGEVCVDYSGNIVPAYSSTSQTVGTSAYPFSDINATNINSASGASLSVGGPIVFTKTSFSAKLDAPIPVVDSFVMLTTSSVAGTFAIAGLPTLSTTTIVGGTTMVPDGQYIVLISTLPGAYNFTLYDNATTAGTRLSLFHGGSVVVSSNSAVSFIYSATDNLWHQIAR